MIKRKKCFIRNRKFLLYSALSLCIICLYCADRLSIFNFTFLYKVEQVSQVIESGSDKYIIPNIQVVDVSNERVQEEANELLRSTFYEIAQLSSQGWNGLNNISATIMCQTSKYLSILYEINYDEEAEIIKNGSGHIGITIDMKTGRRVFLSDLFKNWIDLYDNMHNFESPYLEAYVPVSREEAKNIYIAASLSETGYLEQKYKDIPFASDYVWEYVFKKPTFYMTNSELVIIRDTIPMNNTHIKLGQVE